MIKINAPKGARYIIKQLNKYGYEAYIVGGCVRDSLLGKEPNDWDITTSAKPDEVKSVFRRTIDTGIEHGTVTVLLDKDYEPNSFEVTTYRVDGEYRDHRRPVGVEFTASLEEDLKRRDFTINAMAYNDETGVVDIFGGMQDLEDGIVRCVGNPSERFDEDALRILRAVRFAAGLGFSIDEATMAAMKEQACYLSDISAERIQVELTKLITSPNPDRIVTAYELGITAVVLPEFDRMMQTLQNTPYHKYTVGMHTVHAMENIPPTPILRYSALLHDVGKPDTKTTDEKGVDHFLGHPDVSEKLARKILKRLRLDNNTIESVCRLVLYHDFGRTGIKPKTFRRFVSKIGIENMEDYLKLVKADLAAQSDYMAEKKYKIYDELTALYECALEESQCFTKKELLIGGRDLLELGVGQGREIGRILDRLLDMVLEEPGLNDRETLLNLAKRMLEVNTD